MGGGGGRREKENEAQGPGALGAPEEGAVQDQHGAKRCTKTPHLKAWLGVQRDGGRRLFSEMCISIGPQRDL